MWRFWIDTGGTFTDCLACDPEGNEYRIKVLSSSAIRGTVVQRVSDCEVAIDLGVQSCGDFFVGYELAVFGGPEWSGEIVGWSSEKSIATVNTNIPELSGGELCSLQSPEEPPTLAVRLLTRTRLAQNLPELSMRLATTRGTNALLEGKGAKVAFFVTKGFRDLLRIGNQQRPDLFELGIRKPEPLHAQVFEVDERIDASGEVIQELDTNAIRVFAKSCQAEGIEAAAIALLHSYLNPSHEREVARILIDFGIEHVSASSEISPLIKVLPRAETVMVDAYLAPIMETYLDAVERGFTEGGRLRVMTSAGGLVSRANYRAKDSLLSGPAGGVVGSANVGRRAGFDRTIAFDMGGTSTDVSRYSGRYDYRFEQRIGSAHVYAPTLRIETVAAGGGSICWFDGMAMRVGPESAGASPGPACYGAGGPLTITDVNLLLGRLDPSQFGIPVFPGKAREAFDALRQEVDRSGKVQESDDALLHGFLDIANERMAEAIRSISIQEGYDPSGYALVAFGGAGGLHACAIAAILGVNTVLFPDDAGLLSAYGLKQARAEAFREMQALWPLDKSHDRISNAVQKLSGEAVSALIHDGENSDSVSIATEQIELRFKGQESGLMIDFQNGSELAERFEQAFEAQYGFTPEQEVEVVSIRVSAVVNSNGGEGEGFASKNRIQARNGSFIDRTSLHTGDSLEGPVVVQDAYSTIYVEEGWSALVGNSGSLRLARNECADARKSDEGVEAVQLELFTNRFLSIVEEMGSLLERSAFSTNVKERKDFSCALLDRNGYLVANAPHIPVHLGALGVCVRTILENFELGPGDVIVSNHPRYGGSHLPDVTLVAGVYSESGDLLGYVANRAHHAEIGGISPGSMPPSARNLAEEGVVISPTYLAKAGLVDWEPVRSVLLSSKYPTRRIEENISDLAAQLASVRFGDEALRSLVREEGVPKVAHYMKGLRQRAEKALRDALMKLDMDQRAVTERLDSGSEISVHIQNNGDRWLIDFSGSAPVQNTNFNATPAIVTSATIYVLRLIANTEIPLNEGFLNVVDIEIPRGMLNPGFDAEPEQCPPVVAGNVELSQRIVDTLVRLFGVAACSQGTMNNFIFGNHRVSYYETIAGGEGATPQREGADGVHTHMTNTAITDPEVFEFRFPARLETFELRKGSGGNGLYSGGDGVRRKIRFLDTVDVSLLAQHRTELPYGLLGGEPGQLGRQFHHRADGSKVELPGSASLVVETNESIEILTPGGGGFGKAPQESGV